MPYATSSRNGKPVQIYYEDIGANDMPVIVMHHGDGSDSQDWKSLGYVEKLQADYRIILIDYLGFGQSDKTYNPSDYTIPLLAADTKVVLDELGVNENAIFFGGSMGGRIGYEIASTPELAGHFSGFIINGMGPSKLDLVTTFGQWAKEGGMENVVRQMKAFMAEPFPKAVEQTFLANDKDAYIAANEYPWPSQVEQLDRIDKPVLLICGEKSDERQDMEENAKTRIKDCEMKIVPGMDHGQTYWSSEQSVPLMSDFIERHQLARRAGHTYG